MSLTAERLRELLEYDPVTGRFWWRVSRGSVQDGALAGALGVKDRYLQIRIDGRLYYCHRLAWLYMTGTWPAGRLDHRDLNGHNNRWENLRPATHSQNIHNTKARKNSRSGIKGVSYNPKRKRWEARIMQDGRTIHLGRYLTKEEAAEAYRLAALARYGDFARS